MTTTEILLQLLIINLGTVFGAGIYEARIVVPLWFTKTSDKGYQVNFDALKNIDTGKRFWGLIATLPLTFLTIINIVFAFKSQAQLQDWWLAACLIILVERLGTFLFFIPTVIKLQRGEKLTASKINSLVSLWVGANYVRNTLTFAALLVTLRALTLAS